MVSKNLACMLLGLALEIMEQIPPNSELKSIQSPPYYRHTFQIPFVLNSEIEAPPKREFVLFLCYYRFSDFRIFPFIKTKDLFRQLLYLLESELKDTRDIIYNLQLSILTAHLQYS